MDYLSGSIFGRTRNLFFRPFLLSREMNSIRDIPMLLHIHAALFIVERDRLFRIRPLFIVLLQATENVIFKYGPFINILQFIIIRQIRARARQCDGQRTRQIFFKRTHAVILSHFIARVLLRLRSCCYSRFIKYKQIIFFLSFSLSLSFIHFTPLDEVIKFLSRSSTLLLRRRRGNFASSVAFFSRGLKRLV